MCPIWRPLNFNNIFLNFNTSTKFQPISVSGYPVAIVRILHGQTGTGYSKMAAAKPEIHIPQFVVMTARRFQWSGIHSRWQAIYLEFSGRHLEFPASGLVNQHHNQYHGITGPSNIEIAVAILFLFCLQAKNLVLTHRRPPYWISHFRVGRIRHYF